jgi:tungstate transport system ATP-binding protein
MELYRIRDVAHFYGEKHVLAIDELTIPSAAIVGLIGPNGSGKSTLLKLLGFQEQPTCGSIFFKGEKVKPFAGRTRFRVTLLTQEPYLLHRSVFDNVAYGLKVRGERGELAARVSEALSLVGLEPEKFSRRKWSALSGGEAQRVALAARLALKPEVLLLDEPTANVDADSGRLIRRASLKAREEWGTTLVVAAHDWQWLYETCDSILHLLQGRLFMGGMGCSISGPWHLGQKNLLHKELEDGQILAVAPFPENREVAVLDPARLHISLPASRPLPQSNSMTLNGSVTSLFLEKSGDTVQAAVKVAELVITVRLERQKVEALHLFPGKEVSVSYDPREIEWF